MSTIITIDTEKILGMIVQNADQKANSLGGADGQIIINQLGHVEYAYPSPGTYYQNADQVDPEDFIELDVIDNEHPLDIVDFQTVARDNVESESGKKIDEFGDGEWDKVTEYTNEWIDEWKAIARGNKKTDIEIVDADGEQICQYTVTWV